MAEIHKLKYRTIKYCSRECYHLADKGRAHEPLEIRFWKKVDKSGECWIWTGATLDYGYGVIGIAGHRTSVAHRVAYELQIGPIPPGMMVLHHCDNPPCVRGDHLFIGSKADNSADMIKKGRHWATGRKFDERVRYSREIVIAIRQRYAAGEGMQKLATAFGMTYPNARSIILRLHRKNIP